MPDNSALATKSIIDHLVWSASAFTTLIYEMQNLPDSGKLLLLEQMCELGRDSSKRYASILQECVIVPLTDVL